MADETVDFTAVDNGEQSAWYIYEDTEYNQELGDEGQSQMEIFEPMIKTEAILDNIQYEPEEVEQGQALVDGLQEAATVSDLSKHNLILKEMINEQGLKTESYFCQECMVEYSDINDFLYQHPGVELLNENPEEEILPESSSIQDKLWDLVEDLKEENNENTLEETQNLVEEEEFQKQEMSDDIKLEVANNDQDRYYCYECHQVFTDLPTAEQHDCTQNAQQPLAPEEEEQTEYITDDTQKVVDFACAYCSQVFSSYDDLLNHIANCQQNVPAKPITTAEGVIYHCEMCNKNYPSLRSYNNHQRLHKKAQGGKLPSVSGPIMCEICNTHFASTKNLRLHMKMHDERALKSIQEALPAGAQTEYNELHQFYCEICNKSFDQRLLTIHKNMHQNVEEYNCSRCNKQFENLLSYEMHMQMHAENKMIASKKPELTEASRNAVYIPKRHQCQYCGKEFQRPYEKVKHERIHTGEKPYNCEVCGKSFRVSYSLTLHLRTHTDIRPYVCATCNKRFKQQSVYVHHLKTHVAERQYKCDLCGKSFRTSVQLCGHKNSHKKPFNCTECNRPFASLYAVKIHMKTHNKGHKSNKNLKNRCEICGASYARIFALRYHLKEQHGLDVEPGQLLSAEYSGSSLASSSTMHHKDLDEETALLMNAATESKINKQLRNFMVDSDDVEDDDDEEEDESIREAEGRVKLNSVYGNIDDDLDETAAATQTILQANEEIIEDNFHTEEIITDW